MPIGNQWLTKHHCYHIEETTSHMCWKKVLSLISKQQSFQMEVSAELGWKKFLKPMTCFRLYGFLRDPALIQKDSDIAAVVCNAAATNDLETLQTLAEEDVDLNAAGLILFSQDSSLEIMIKELHFIWLLQKVMKKLQNFCCLWDVNQCQIDGEILQWMMQ